MNRKFQYQYGTRKKYQLFSDTNANRLFFVSKLDTLLYGCGLNEYGQVGVGNVDTFDDSVTVPTRVLKMRKNSVIHVALGSAHTIFHTKQGFLSCGDNTRGCGNRILLKNNLRMFKRNDDEHTFVLPEGEDYREVENQGVSFLQGIRTPRRVDVVDNKMILKCFCTEHAAFLLLKPGNIILSAGRNDYGQLGGGHSNNLISDGMDSGNPTGNITPLKVQFPPGETIQKVDGSWGHTIFHSMHGNVWLCGRNAHGEVCIGSEGHVSVPTKIDFGGKIVSVGSGQYHCLFLRADGTVFVSGTTRDNQLGIHKGSYNEEDAPVELKFSNKQRQDDHQGGGCLNVRNIWCLANSSLFFHYADVSSSTTSSSSSGIVVGCGGTIDEYLKDQVNPSCTFPSSLSTESAKKALTYMSPCFRVDKKWEQVAMQYNSVVVLTRLKIYAWGRNDCRHLFGKQTEVENESAFIERLAPIGENIVRIGGRGYQEKGERLVLLMQRKLFMEMDQDGALKRILQNIIP